MTSLLSIRDLSIGFEGEGGLSTAVAGVDLDVRRGEVVALVGESGSGKSVTSLSILQLLASPPACYLSGEILFTGRDGRTSNLLARRPAGLRSIRGAEIGMIFQEPMSSLNPVFTCGDQVAEAIRAHRRVSAADARREVIDLFRQVQLPDPEDVFRRWPHQLSGGQKQRVMIAMAMSSRPSLLICDEPTTALDVTVQKTVLRLLRQLQDESDMGMIFITHDLGVVAEIADRALVLYKGKVVEEGAVEELFSRPRHPYTRGLLNCRPALHKKGERLPVVNDFLEGAPASPARVIAAAKGEQTKGAILLKVEALRVWYPSKKTFFGKVLHYTKAVDGVTFDVLGGETLGLVGESGCGKTTLGRALLRLVEPTDGRVFFDGTDLRALKPRQMKPFRSRMQLIFQDPYSSLNPRMTIGSAIAEAMKVHGVGSTDKERKDRVIRLLERVGMGAEYDFNKWPHEFSGGQRQRIVIARALALQPDFIIADEAVSALDVSVQAQVLNLLNDLKAEFGFTVIFISHDLSVIRFISDRIMVMNRGRIEEMGDAETVYLQPRSAYTKSLIASIPRAK
jgi:peptide/nickel transport system ATP-binding protein